MVPVNGYIIGFNILLPSFSVSLLHCSNKNLQEVAGVLKCALCVDLFQDFTILQLSVTFQGIVLAAEQQAGRQVWACLCNITVI